MHELYAFTGYDLAIEVARKQDSLRAARNPKKLLRNRGRINFEETKILKYCSKKLQKWRHFKKILIL